jgi:N-acetylmuramic acid 6-phosphate etherase
MGAWMPTEHLNERFVEIDSWSTSEAVEAMLEGQLSAVAAVKPIVPLIAKASEHASARLARGGRLVYVGAGTSGRIAAQDGVELTPTYGWPKDRIKFVIAGGMEALAASAEAAEDDGGASAEALSSLNLNAEDVVIGVAASGETRFTVSALEAANKVGALTIGIANNENTPLLQVAEFGLCAETGSELVAGSTRMKAGTAQKVILNLFSTATMIRCGRVYKGLMVNMLISNSKLKRRATEIVQQLTNADVEAATKAIEAGQGDLKSAILIGLGYSSEEAASRLQSSNGNLRAAIENNS